VNTKIKLTIMRKGSDKAIELTIVRDVIRVKSVRSHSDGNDIGYIRITQFTEQTTDGLKKAISDLTSQLGADNIKGFAIDLRNNPGGLLDQAISVSDAFLDRGEMGVPYSSHQVRCQMLNCQIVEKREQGTFVDRYSGPAARSLEINYVPLRACERKWRKSERPIGWARRRCLEWRMQGNARHDPLPSARQASCEKFQAIKSKEHRRDMRLSTTVRFATQLVTDLPNAHRTLRLLSGMGDSEAAPSTHVWSNRSTKKSSSFARADLHVGGERVRPNYSLRVHCWAAEPARSEV
jgi:hypothetical protein